MKLGKCVIAHFGDNKSNPHYWGKPYPVIQVIRANIKQGKIEEAEGNRIIVEYGWGDASVILQKENNTLLFDGTISST